MDNKNIITSLDDFGISRSANHRFLELAKTARIRRIAVMSNGHVSRDEAKELLDSGIKLDIHLDMEENVKSRRKLREGSLKRLLIFFFKFLTYASPERMERIWEKQIAEFERIFGRKPDGLNSHQHIHFFPPYFNRAIELAKKHDLKFIRMAKKSSFSNGPIPLILNFLRNINSQKLIKSGLETTGALVSFDWIKNPESFFTSDQHQNTEVIFHPERDEEFLFLKNHFKK